MYIYVYTYTGELLKQDKILSTALLPLQGKETLLLGNSTPFPSENEINKQSERYKHDTNNINIEKNMNKNNSRYINSSRNNKSHTENDENNSNENNKESTVNSSSTNASTPLLAQNMVAYVTLQVYHFKFIFLMFFCGISFVFFFDYVSVFCFIMNLILWYEN